MAALTDFAENKLIDFIFRGQALGIASSTAAAGSGPSALYVALFTTLPTEAGGGVEVTGGSYQRKGVACNLTNWAGTQGAGSTTVSTGTSGTTSNNILIEFAAPTASWGTIVGYAVYDSLTAGNPIFYTALSAPKLVSNGDIPPVFEPGTLSFQMDN